MDIIRIIDGSKTFFSEQGDVHALVKINMSIRDGEFMSLLGPSGCGKSTLLRCVAGLERLTGGELKVRGQIVRESPEELGIVFQRDLLVDWRTVLGNVLLIAEFRGMPRKSAEKRARELLALFGLAEYGERSPWELSGGMRQRVAICRALLDDPTILLMDEPFAALDAMTREQLNIELQHIWLTTKKTVLFITHSIPEAVFLSDRIAVMSRNPGTIIETIDIELPRPRRLDLRDGAAFGEYSAHLRKTFLSLGILREK